MSDLDAAALVFLGNALLFYIWLRVARIVTRGSCPVCGQKEKDPC